MENIVINNYEEVINACENEYSLLAQIKKDFDDSVAENLDSIEAMKKEEEKPMDIKEKIILNRLGNNSPPRSSFVEVVLFDEIDTLNVRLRKIKQVRELLKTIDETPLKVLSVSHTPANSTLDTDCIRLDFDIIDESKLVEKLVYDAVFTNPIIVYSDNYGIDRSSFLNLTYKKFLDYTNTKLKRKLQEHLKPETGVPMSLTGALSAMNNTQVLYIKEERQALTELTEETFIELKKDFFKDYIRITNFIEIQ